MSDQPRAHRIEYTLDRDWYFADGEDRDIISTITLSTPLYEQLEPDWDRVMAYGEEGAREAVLARLSEEWPDVPAHAWRFGRSIVDEDAPSDDTEQ